jgi:poly(A) polymerase
LQAVPEAFVPILKMYFSEVPIDLLCSRLADALVPEEFDIMDPNLLKTLDEQSWRSLNGESELPFFC